MDHISPICENQYGVKKNQQRWNYWCWHYRNHIHLALTAHLKSDIEHSSHLNAESHDAKRWQSVLRNLHRAPEQLHLRPIRWGRYQQSEEVHENCALEYYCCLWSLVETRSRLPSVGYWKWRRRLDHIRLGQTVRCAHTLGHDPLHRRNSRKDTLVRWLHPPVRRRQVKNRISWSCRRYKRRFSTWICWPPRNHNPSPLDEICCSCRCSHAINLPLVLSEWW